MSARRTATHYYGATPGTAVDPADGGARGPLILRDAAPEPLSRAQGDSIIQALGEILRELTTLRLAMQRLGGGR